jgi:hypothetical protein
MKYEDYLYLAEFPDNSGLDPIFEEDYFQNLDLDSELDQFIDEIDIDGMHDLHGGQT